MDAYGGYTSQPAIAPPTSSLSTWKILGGLVACFVVLGVVFFVMRKDSSEGKSDGGKGIGTPSNVGSRASAPTSSTANESKPSAVTGMQDELKWATDAPEAKLATFAFEPKTKPLFVPNKQAQVARKPAGNPPYKLVGCNSTGAYAIRWNGRYLTVLSANSVKWTEEKQEPGSCFKLVPGYCGGGSNFVMLRSVANKLFLRPDGASGQLVCKDTPTARTADTFCWKLNPETTVKQPCGPQYSYDLGRVIDVPCDVKKMPSNNESCSTVTAGYQAECCIQKKGSAAQDRFCDSTIFPKVVGRSLQEAILYIRTRRPDLSLKPCPEPCTIQAVPIQSPNVVLIPYDARSQIVTSIPRRIV